MNYEKGEKLRDINELLDMLREGKAYYERDDIYTAEDASYYSITRNTWECCHHAIPKKEKKKYYKAWYKLEDNYTLEVPPHYFENRADLNTWLSGEYTGNEFFTIECGLTDEFIEV